MGSKIKIALILIVILSAFFSWHYFAESTANSEKVIVAQHIHAGETESDNGRGSGKNQSSAVESVSAVPQSAVHSVMNAKQLQVRADKIGFDDPDVRYSIALAMDLCDDDRFPRVSHLTAQGMIDYATQSGRTSQATLSSAFRSTFCNHLINIPESFPIESLADPSSYIYETNSILAKYKLTDDSSENDDEDTADLLFTLKNTGSFFTFIEAGNLLVSKGLLGSALVQHGLDSTLPFQTNVSAAGLVLAGCRIFGGCEAGSLYALNRCFLVCEHSMGVEELVRTRLSVQEIQQTEKLATSILLMRNSP